MVALIATVVITRGESAAPVLEQQAAVRLAAKLPKDPGLFEFVEKLIAGGVEVRNVNVNILDASGNALGEIDVITKNALIQYKNGASSAHAVLDQLYLRTLPYVDRVVVTFVNDVGKAGKRTVDKVAQKGELITNKIDELIDLIK